MANAPRAMRSCDGLVAGQAALELVLTVVGSLVLLAGTIKVFAWVNQGLVQRQAAFQDSRLQAGSSTPGEPKHPYQQPPLRILGLPTVVTPPSTVPSAVSGACPAAEELIRQADALMEEAKQSQDQLGKDADEAVRRANEAEPLLGEAAQLRADGQALEGEAAALEAKGGEENVQAAANLRSRAQHKYQKAADKETEAQANLQKNPQAAAKLHDVANRSGDMQPRMETAQSKFEEAQDLYAQAQAEQIVCEGSRTPSETVEVTQ